MVDCNFEGEFIWLFVFVLLIVSELQIVQEESVVWQVLCELLIVFFVYCIYGMVEGLLLIDICLLYCIVEWVKMFEIFLQLEVFIFLSCFFIGDVFVFSQEEVIQFCVWFQ